jgi:hypothetical protein
MSLRRQTRRNSSWRSGPLDSVHSGIVAGTEGWGIGRGVSNLTSAMVNILSRLAIQLPAWSALKQSIAIQNAV